MIVLGEVCRGQPLRVSRSVVALDCSLSLQTLPLFCDQSHDEEQGHSNGNLPLYMSSLLPLPRTERNCFIVRCLASQLHVNPEASTDAFRPQNGFTSGNAAFLQENDLVACKHDLLFNRLVID